MECAKKLVETDPENVPWRAFLWKGKLHDALADYMAAQESYS